MLAKRLQLVVFALTLNSVGAWFGSSQEWEFEDSIEEEYDWVRPLLLYLRIFVVRDTRTIGCLTWYPRVSICRRPEREAI